MKLARLLAPALVLLPACVLVVRGNGDWDWQGWSDDWSDSCCTSYVEGREVQVDEDGVVTIDDVELHYQRWVDVAVTADQGSIFRASTASGPIDLHGVEGAGAISVLLHIEYEGDGRVSLDGGKLIAQGNHGEVFIDAVRGSLPRTLELSLSSGIGEIALRDFGGGPLIKVENGTGAVSLADCSAPAVELNSGTGDVRVEGGTAERLEVDVGTSEVYCKGAHIGTAAINSGTGDLSFVGCEIGRLKASAGTGDVIIDGGRVDRVEHDLGTGDLQVRGGAQIGA